MHPYRIKGLFRIADCLFRNADCLFRVANCVFRVADSLFRIADGLFRFADDLFRQSTASRVGKNHSKGFIFTSSHPQIYSRHRFEGW